LGRDERGSLVVKGKEIECKLTRVDEGELEEAEARRARAWRDGRLLVSEATARAVLTVTFSNNL